MLCESWTFERWYSEPGQLREGQGVGAALVGDLDEALFDVDVRRAVLAHRAELDQVAVGHRSRIDQSRLSVPITLFRWVSTACGARSSSTAPTAARRSGRSPPGWTSARTRSRNPVGDVADEGVDLLPGDLAPGVDAVSKARWASGSRSMLVMPAAAGEVVDEEDVVPARRETHRGRPPRYPSPPRIRIRMAGQPSGSPGGARRVDASTKTVIPASAMTSGISATLRRVPASSSPPTTVIPARAPRGGRPPSGAGRPGSPAPRGPGPAP